MSAWTTKRREREALQRRLGRRPANGTAAAPAPAARTPIVVDFTRDKECHNVDRFAPDVSRTPNAGIIPDYVKLYLPHDAFDGARPRRVLVTVKVID